MNEVSIVERHHGENQNLRRKGEKEEKWKDKQCVHKWLVDGT